PLLGEFQIMNILCAVGMALASGATPEQMDAVLPKLEGVPGRMEHVATHKGAPIFVDYAHTPGGLEGVLKHLRPHVKGRSVLVFGCGGDRDRGKRPQMGEIAAQYADQVFVTDDNPRTENPLLIRKDVLAGCPDAEEIGDRKEAIEAAINTLKKGDALLIAGKGHEKMQIIGTVSHPFDDAQVARQATGKKPKQ
ncbi:MAG: Mur ligase family protein, partial [Rickettsiales bacterium]